MVECCPHRLMKDGWEDFLPIARSQEGHSWFPGERRLPLVACWIATITESQMLPADKEVQYLEAPFLLYSSLHHLIHPRGQSFRAP